MNALSRVFVFKIAATVLVWCLVLLLFPTDWLAAAGLPVRETDLFLRLLGWAYLALCVGYGFGLHVSLQGKRALGPIWVGIVSNGGAFLYLLFYGANGAWSAWGPILQIVGWGSVVATLLITAGLIRFGVLGEGEVTG